MGFIRLVIGYYQSTRRSGRGRLYSLYNGVRLARCATKKK